MVEKIYQTINTCRHIDVFDFLKFGCLVPLYRNWRTVDYMLCLDCTKEHMDYCDNYHDKIDFGLPL